jgi:hypothetical protein
MLGHDGPPTAFWRENLITGATLERCPVRTLLDARQENPQLVAEVESYLTTLYPAYRDGHLLVAGGVADQPARYWDVINMIRDVASKGEEKFIELTTKKDEE